MKTAESEELRYLKDCGILVHHVLAVGVEQTLELGGHHVHPAQGAHRQQRKDTAGTNPNIVSGAVLWIRIRISRIQSFRQDLEKNYS